ncbi:MAG TPA: AsmA family protein [Verrucomicrobiae bacterium]|nr:AsmA family protein [Verrucomicrobiae bacterium]
MAEPMFILAKPRKRPRRWLRFFAALVMVMMVLIVLAFFFVTNPAFIHDVILPRLGKAINADVTVSSMTFNPFKQIVLHDLKVQVDDQTPVFTASEVNVRYHLWDILRGNLHVDEIALNSPTIERVENPDGSSNLDPLLKALRGKSAKAGKARPVSSKAPRIDLGKISLRDASIVEIKNYGDGRSNVLALTNLDFTLSNLKNGQSAALQLSAALRVEQNPPGGTNGFLEAAIKGDFNFVLSPDLKPASASGQAQVAVSGAGGAFGDFSTLDAGLNCEATSVGIKQLDLHFQNAGASLGELTASGPLNLSTMEGSLQVALRGVGRRLLNLAGAVRGLDFGSTTLNSTNEITLTHSGQAIGASGRFVVDKFQVTRAGQTTPPLDLSADYAVSVDYATQTARLQQLTLAGTQNGRPLLAARLSQPMSLAWGNSEGGVGDSALDLDVTNLNLADWRPFLGSTVSAGDVNLQLKLSSQQGGKQLGFDLSSEINDLMGQLASNRTFQASVNLQAQGGAVDFKQFNLSAGRLQILRQNQPLLSVTAAGAYNVADASADAEVTLDGSLPGLSGAFPQPGNEISAGTLKLNARVTQKQNAQTVAGKLVLADLTGRVGGNSYQNFGSAMDLEVSRTPDRIQIQKLNGTVTQNGSAKGNFVVSGALESANKTAQLNIKLTSFDQDGLRPFLEPLLAGKQLVSVAVNGNVSLQYAPNSSSAVKADLQVANLVVHDPRGQFPAAPLAARLQIDTTLQKQTADIRQLQISLTPTSRATNQIQLQGGVDFSQPSAVHGNLTLSSESLDLTRYYDLFTGPAKASGQTVTGTPSATPASIAAYPEPQPVILPLRNFTLAADIGQLYLHEVAITSFQTTLKVDGGHVQVKPFKLMLNDAPVSGAADLDLSVPGYKYKLALSAVQVPLTPLVDSFTPDRQGQLGGTLTTHAQIAGTGITGADLKQNLTGQFDVGATNLNLSVDNVRSPILKGVIDVVAMVPQLISNPGNAIISLLNHVVGRGNDTLMNQLQQSPIETIAVQGRARNGRIDLQLGDVQSAAFEADATGTIALAPALTNSTINIPITILLCRSIANQLNLAAASTTTGAYVPLPQFLTMTRTLGDPKADISRLALAGIAAQSVGNSLVNPATGNSSPVGSLLNQLLRR